MDLENKDELRERFRSLNDRVDALGRRLDARIDALTSRVDSCFSGGVRKPVEMASQISELKTEIAALRRQIPEECAGAVLKRQTESLYDLAADLAAAFEGDAI